MQVYAVNNYLKQDKGPTFIFLFQYVKMRVLNNYETLSSRA